MSSAGPSSASPPSLQSPAKLFLPSGWRGIGGDELGMGSFYKPKSSALFELVPLVWLVLSGNQQEKRCAILGPKNKHPKGKQPALQVCVKGPNTELSSCLLSSLPPDATLSAWKHAATTDKRRKEENKRDTWSIGA